MRMVLLLTAALCGCASEFGHMTAPPRMSAPGGGEPAIPAIDAARRELVTPSDVDRTPTPASLWRSGPDSLFGDRRARQRGDIVTVVVEIDDEAEFRNQTDREKTGEQSVTIPALFGVEQLAQQVLPEGAGLDPAVEASSSSTTRGAGVVQRQEKIEMRVAATVVDVLPNGHFSIRGTQEIRVNYERRDLHVAGVIRPEDISRANTITYDKIADARIVYGGRGQITDLQRAGVGQQIIEKISPF